jgi:uncharacterized protein YbaR (Trm112 family)
VSVDAGVAICYSREALRKGLLMAIAQELLDILVCPVDKVKVGYTEDRVGLRCPKCGRVYPLRDGIPVMLVGEAKVAGAGVED